MILEITVIIIYTIAILFIFIYAIAQLNLLVNFLSFKKKEKSLKELDLSNLQNIPNVTIQLPVYNEMYVMERLLANIAQINYPKEKLEIQVLDDSTDESLKQTAQKVSNLKAQGLDIKHIHRKNRKDFKAGALREGLNAAKGDFIAIFDADFLPQSDWLLQTVPYFEDKKIGVVQTRWGHINRDYSLLTKVQAFALDVHFSLEQVGRNSKGHFINFNGTAGIWRKECIMDAGNWQGDTLTEDLDLSYRAQFKNWKFKYLENVETPAELPVIISAARSQQFRWNKGGAENFRKMLYKLVNAKNIPVKTRVHGFLHLLNSGMFLNILIVAILSVPMLYIKNEYPSLRPYFYMLSFFVISSIIFFICYWFMYKHVHGKSGFKGFVKYLGMFFVFFSIAMGFSLHNSIAVIEGYIGKKSDFIRTPKFNIRSLNDKWKGNKYIKKSISLHVIFEGLLMIYFAFGMYSAFIVGNQGGDFGLFPFHLMLFLGFGYVFVNSITSKI
ncbi:cellulose synthase family protein [Aureibaculum conchae]|uniref:cellulose synthase family protein n=1 Tax=Aureibaculum sp. 2308TA14-22 TaxID=3108392 RepID=UPI003395DFDD